MDGTPFYVGKGSGNRAYSKRGRSSWWFGIVQKDFGTDGFPTTELLESNLSEEDAFISEEFWISHFGRHSLGEGTLINLTNGGDGATGLVHSASSKQKMSIIMTERAPWKGKNLNDTHKKKISDALRGKRVGYKHKKSSIKKMRLVKSGSNNPNYGKVRSITARNKSAASNGNIKPTLIHSSGLVVTVENYHEFQRLYGIDYRRVGELARGKRKSHKGWMLLTSVLTQ